MNPDEKYPYQGFGGFLVRTPSLPFRYGRDLFAREDTSFESILSFWEKEIIKEAVYLASPGLFDQLEKLAKAGIREKKYANRLSASLLKYLMRMTYRTTPFGIFAAVSKGTWAHHTRIELEALDQARVYMQADMEYLGILSENLVRNTRTRKQLRYFPNSTLYNAGNICRFVEFRQSGGMRTHHIIEIEMDEELEKVLGNARKGKTIQELKECLLTEDADDPEAEFYISELIDNQVLVPELQASLSASVYLDDIIGLLEKLNGTKTKHKGLASLRKELVEYNRVGGQSKRLQQIGRLARGSGNGFNNMHFVQATMERPCKSCSIDSKVHEQLRKAVRVLKALSPGRELQDLIKFKDRFIERYDMQEVPLLRALDPDIGIPYGLELAQMDPSPLIDDLRLPESKQDERPPVTSDTDLLLTRYYEALKQGKNEICLKEEDFKEREISFDDLPHTFNVCFRVLENTNHGAGIEIHWAGGASAASMIGRFCSVNKDIHQLAKEITEFEAAQQPDAVLAEIIHLPEERTANILQRPSLCEYEIPYLAKSTLPEYRQIHLQDLLVAVRDNQVVLISKDLGKRILPRLSSAHNYSRNAIPVYRFLCDLQYQGLHDNLSFSWDSLASRFSSFPRVSFEKTILSPAIWIIREEDLLPLKEIPGEAKHKEPVVKWRDKHNIPECFILSDYDNEMIINLANRKSLEIFLQLIQGRKEIIIKEILFDDDKAIARCAEDAYNHEIIAPFFKLK